MKILFALRSELYLRHFHTTLRLAASQGHEVILCYEQNKDPRALENPDPLGDSGVRLAGLVPIDADRHQVFCDRLRGVVDYMRYLHPDFRNAQALRARLRSGLPWWLRWLDRVRSVPPGRLDPFLRWLIGIDERVPAAPKVREFIRRHQPDLVVVSPLVDSSSRQVEMVKAARELGVPSALCVASWDNLTNKGLIRVIPDRVILWNDDQRAEAERYHFVPPERIRLTGAQLFDRWFHRAPSQELEELTRRAGLPVGRPYLLFCGSSKFITGTIEEVRVVRRWLQALRASGDPTLREVPVLIRPHPQNCRHWREVDLGLFGDVAIWPREGVDTTSRSHQSDYFDSLYHSLAVCGANTSALIEAAIVGRGVLIVPAPELEHSQAGTLHFRYLLEEHGGFARNADDLAGHVRQLSETLREPAAVKARAAAFVRRFVRPLGLDRACDPMLVEELISLADTTPRPFMLRPVPWLGPASHVIDLLELRALRGRWRRPQEQGVVR